LPRVSYEGAVLCDAGIFFVADGVFVEHTWWKITVDLGYAKFLVF
jgi:hypothetical protein